MSYMRKMQRDEKGHIVVETVGTFVPLVLLVISILSLVNIITVQARIHYALTQAANTLSIYCYTLEVMGVADTLIALDEKASVVPRDTEAMKRDLSSVFTAIGSLSSGNDGGISASETLGGNEETSGNPMAVIEILMNYGKNELRNQLFEELARPLVGRYLANGLLSGDAYLRRAGIVNSRTGSRGIDALEFHQLGNFGTGNSVLIDANGNVKLTVEYEVDYTFGALPLPFKLTLRITQTAVTKAWLGGSGTGYRG